ncbi:uncharacterized protein K441DRAFT_163500 [Cenococcum geophilum 1.58]|uniref:uncharacterized protein n=1 Tax=Cenococcum geophilum 1.58 TaxID=794803 RepID=UPI00358FF80F|nr:hypothetical protein K441DRAFT_163500 [Cenococcum geophilum 1.58]
MNKHMKHFKPQSQHCISPRLETTPEKKKPSGSFQPPSEKSTRHRAPRLPKSSSQELPSPTHQTSFLQQCKDPGKNPAPDSDCAEISKSPSPLTRAPLGSPSRGNPPKITRTAETCSATPAVRVPASAAQLEFHA